MEVKKLYYEDCRLREFTARVLSCTETADGFHVTLDATAFYPEGGGQACDLGTLADAHVLDVQENAEQILHLCDRPLEPGSTVTGRIDWERRFDLMQQHTGEHIVSGIIFQTYGYHNVGFHMGEQFITIDFDGPIPPEDLPAIQDRANRAVWEDLALRCWVPEPEELPAINYRRKRDLPWPVRIVQIPGIDQCACCGVQVASTGQVGAIKLLSCVKFHQGVRIEMVCGGRAMSLFDRSWEQNRQVSQAFSAKPLETGEAARRMNDQLAAEKLRAAGLEKQVFAATAQTYQGQALALHFGQSLTPGAVRELADTIAKHAQTAAVLSGSDGAGYTLCIVSHEQDVRPLGSATVKALDGRGGGKPQAFQGSIRAKETEIRAFFAQWQAANP